MKDLLEELKAIRNSHPKEPPSLNEIEEIAKKVSIGDCNNLNDNSSLLNRMIPPCYSNFTFSNLNMTNLHEETLFYIFYSLTESTLQIKAFNELIKKGYSYSKHFESFVMLYDDKIADNNFKNILIFDPWEWGKVSKEVLFNEDFINSLKFNTIEEL